MFCSSLRKRKEWATVPAILLSHQPQRFQENTLEGHDLALPIPQAHIEAQKECFRIILLSSSDLQSPDAMNRIERLYHQQGGQNVGLIFLLHEASQKENGMHAFMNLQASLVSKFDMPILPLFQISSLVNTLFAFQRQLKKPLSTIPPIHALTALLPYCSNNPPIPEHPRNVLSDICNSIPDLSIAATTEPEGLQQWLSDAPGVIEEVVGFWQQEYLVD